MSKWRCLAADGRHAWRLLKRAPGFTLPALFSAALAVGLVVALLGVVDVASLGRESLSSVLRVDAVREAGWGATAAWSGSLVAPGVQQAAGLDAILMALALAVGVAVAIAALALSNLLLSRSGRRGLELAIQSALGATPRRLLLRLAVEGACLGVMGVVLGLLLGFAGGAVLRLGWPHTLAPTGDGWQAQTLTLGVLLPIAALVLLPVIAGYAVTGGNGSASLLRSGDRVLSAGRGLVRDAFAIAQLAASLALLVGAGLLLRDPVGTGARGGLGFEMRDTLRVAVDLDAAALATPAERARYFEGLLAALRRDPSIADSAISTPGTMLSLGSLGRAVADCGRCYLGGAYVPLLPGAVAYHAVGPGFFSALGIELLRGREFDDGDRLGSARVAIVSAAFAAGHFEGGEAVGRAVRAGGMTGTWYRVVGVAPDLPGAGVGAGAVPALYVPLLQQPPLAADIAVRAVPSTGGSATELAAVVEEVAGALGPGGRIVESASLEAVVDHQLAPLRWLGRVLAAAGAAALLLAVQGLASVMSYDVLRRRRELAVRMSVGAGAWAVMRLVLRRTAAIAGLGVVIGVCAALPLVGWAGEVLPSAAPFDPSLAGLVAGVLLVATLLGGAVPAWSAARSDPGRVLRE